VIVVDMDDDQTVGMSVTVCDVTISNHNARRDFRIAFWFHNGKVILLFVPGFLGFLTPEALLLSVPTCDRGHDCSSCPLHLSLSASRSTSITMITLSIVWSRHAQDIHHHRSPAPPRQQHHFSVVVLLHNPLHKPKLNPNSPGLSPH
jgi:hypothetical protein